MILSKETIKIIENYSQINPVLLFEKGNELKTVDNTGTFFSYAKIEEEIPQEFALPDLGEFIRIISTYDNPEISFGDISIIISNNNSSTEYFIADDMIKEQIDESTKERTNAKIPEPDKHFFINSQKIIEIRKITSILDNTHIGFTYNDGYLCLSSRNFRVNSGNLHDIRLVKSDKFPDMFFTRDSFDKIMILEKDLDYTVKLMYDQIAEFHLDKIDLKYWMLPTTE